VDCLETTFERRAVVLQDRSVELRDFWVELDQSLVSPASRTRSLPPRHNLKPRRPSRLNPALSVTPTSLTVIASCSQNGNTYPVGPTNSAGEVDNVIPGSSTEIIWSPFDYEQQPGNTPLAAATYRLQIYDERGPAASQAGGRFSPYSGMQFALYRPQTYKPLSGMCESEGGGGDSFLVLDVGLICWHYCNRDFFSEWNCVNCNAATRLALNPISLMLFTSLIMLISGWGLIGGGRRQRA